MSLYHDDGNNRTECEMRPWGKRGILFWCPECFKSVGRDALHKIAGEEFKAAGRHYSTLYVVKK